MEDSTKLKEVFQDECALVEMIERKEEDCPWPSTQKDRAIDAPFTRDLKPWKLYFDRSRCIRGSEAGVALISP